MIVAAGTVDRQAVERRHGGGDHVVAIVRAGDLLVERSFAQLDVADEIPRPGRDETGRHGGLRIVGKQDVAGELLGHEPVVRLVVVEARNDVVAIRPGVAGAGLSLS